MDWIGRLPTTNFRIFVGVMLAVVFVAVLLVGAVMGRVLDDGTRMTVAVFIGVMMGLDVTQFSVKRATTKPELVGQTRESIDPAPPQPAALNPTPLDVRVAAVDRMTPALRGVQRELTRVGEIIDAHAARVDDERELPRIVAREPERGGDL